MKNQRYILIVLTFFACVTFVIAQEKKPGLPAGAQTVIVDGPNGQDYTSAAGRFKILFPGIPRQSETTFETGVGKLVSHTVSFVTEVAQSVDYYDYPGNLEQPNVVKRALDEARDYGLTRFAEETPQVVSETDVSVEGHPGRLLRVELKGDAILRLKILLVANRTYVLTFGTPKRTDVQAEYEKQATRFFDSFKLMSPVEADLTWNVEGILIRRRQIQDQVSGNPLPGASTTFGEIEVSGRGLSISRFI